MKCLLVVNQLNDPFYIDYNDSFAKYVIKRAKEQGMVEVDSTVSELDSNLVMQLFSPLILSQWLLIDQTKEPCSAIHCPNGFCFAFKHVDDHLILAINGDGTETETFLHRKIQVFIRLIRFMFGPVSEEVGQSGLVSKKAKWSFVRLLMKNWAELVDTEQAFAFEAIERLHVNQMVSQKCVEVLEQAVKQVQAVRDIPAQHALLLANSKLLALYSNRSANELQPNDVLALMTLTRALYPLGDRLEDLFSRQYRNIRSGVFEGPGGISDEGAEDEDEFHSAPTTPGGQRSRTSSIDGLSRDESSLSASNCPGDAMAQCSETDTIHNALSSEQNSSSLTGSVDQEISLLQMYEKKYPDKILSKKSQARKKEEKSSDKISQSDLGAVSNVETSSVPKLGSQAEHGTDGNVEATSAEPKSVSQTEHRTEGHGEEFPKSKLDGQQYIHEEMSEPKQGNLQEHSTDGNGDQPPEPTLSSQMDDNGEALPESEVSQIDPIPTRVSSVDTTHSRTSTLSSGQDVTDASQPSITSSVVSAQSKSYPELSASLPSSAVLNSDLGVTDSGIDRTKRTKSHTPVSMSSQTDTLDGWSVINNSGSQTPANQTDTPETRSVNLSSVTNSSNQSTSVTTPPATNTESSSIAPSAISGSAVEPAVGKEPNPYIPQTVFLETSTCLYSPYHIHTAQVLPGVTLVLLSQAPRRNLADSLYQVTHNIQDLLYGRRIKLSRSRGLHVYEIINSLLGRLHSSLKKYKGRVRTLSYDIHTSWEKEDLKHKLLDYLEKDARTPMPADLESPMVELYKKLKDLFSCLFLGPVSENQHLYEVLSQLRVHINSQLLDYREYLNVKAQRNITMTSYIDDFPGLIHFVFIDRHFHQMTAPSLNFVSPDGEGGKGQGVSLGDATEYLKAKIWAQYQRAMGQLMKGYTTVMLRDGDFYFSYFLWFEDISGNMLQVQEHFQPSRKSPYPGLLTGSFYRDLVQHCFPQAIQGSVHCFEMFLVHLSSVHPQFVATQCRKLAHRMWEMNGEAFSVSLF